MQSRYDYLTVVLLYDIINHKIASAFFIVSSCTRWYSLTILPLQSTTGVLSLVLHRLFGTRLHLLFYRYQITTLFITL